MSCRRSEYIEIQCRHLVKRGRGPHCCHHRRLADHRCRGHHHCHYRRRRLQRLDSVIITVRTQLTKRRHILSIMSKIVTEEQNLPFFISVTFHPMIVNIKSMSMLLQTGMAFGRQVREALV
jgi:hypothetical protein